MRRFFAVAAASLAIAGCNPLAQVNEADNQIEQFHTLYSAQDSAAIYAMTGPEFREVTDPQQWDGLMAHVFQRLGPVEESSQSGVNIDTQNGVTVTVITRETSYANDEGTEVFTFFGSGEEMRLGGWEVESDALVGTTLPASASQGAPAPAGKPGMEGSFGQKPGN